MLFMDFPIQGPLRLPLLVLEWLFSLIAFQLGLVFLLRYKKPEKELRNLNELGYASLLMGLSAMWIFFIGGDYFASDEIQTPFYIWASGSERMALITLGYLSVMIGAFFCIFLMEIYKIYLFRRYFFTIIFLILISIFIITCFVNLMLTQSISFLFWPLFLFFFFTYMIDLGRKIKIKEKRVSGVMKFLSGFVLIALGFMLTTDTSIQLLGLQSRLIGAILQLIAVIFIFYFLITLPPFSEFEWQDQLENLFLIDKGGICLYSHSFKGEEIADENLISGAISSINVMLGELTDGKGSTMLERKGKIITIVPGNFTFGVIFSKEDLKTIKSLLKIFLLKVENLYRNVFDKWDGNLDIFKPVEKIINDVFKNKK